MVARNERAERECTDRVDLRARLALRPSEAARVLGVSERTLRGMLPELPHVRRGGLVMIPVRMLQDWLDEQCEAGAAATDRIANEIIAKLEDE